MAEIQAIRLTAQDWVATNWLHLRWTRDQWLTQGLAVFILAVAGALLIFNESLSPLMVMPGAALMSLPLTIWVICPLMNLIAMPFRARRLFRQTGNSADPFDISWDAESITFTSEAWMQKSRWSDFPKWRENRQLFMLYINAMSFRIIPKRAFKDAATLAEFSALIRSKVGSDSAKIAGKSHLFNRA